MVLAQDIRDNPTGIILLSSGSIITEKALQAIGQFDTPQKCLIYSEDKNSDFQEKQKIEKNKLQNGEIIRDPEINYGKPAVTKDKRNLQAKIIYRDTFKTLKDLYKKATLNKAFDLYEISKAAENIAAEITHDPQILLQIAFLKTIDDYTFSHAVHVSIYVTSLAKFLNFSPQQLREICLAGLLHDIGKVDIPAEIVKKPGKLTAEEYEIMKEHVRYGYNRIYNFSGISKDVLYSILQHHERMDGSGYLQRLKGSEIHQWARLLAIADVYDAITTDRVYRNAFLPHEGAEILMSNSGKLDTQYLNVFIHNITFYPVGCKVALSTGEIGTVISTHRNMPLRPVVRVSCKEGQRTRTINLLEDLTTFITSIVKK